MTLIDYAYLLFKDVKNEKYSFSYAINKKINKLNLTNSETQIVKDSLKAMMNHYYFLRYEINSRIENLKDAELDYLALSLSFCKYARSVNCDDVVSMIKESYVDNKLTISIEDIENALKDAKNNPTDVDKLYEHDLVKKLSLKYSYPEWLVRMLNKHFRVNNTYKSIASSRKSTPINVACNLMKSSLEEVSNNNAFKKTELSFTSFKYVDSKPLIQNELFKEKKVFVVDEQEQALVDALNVNQGDEILIIGEEHHNLALLTSTRMYDFGKVHYHTSIENSFYASKNNSKIYKINSLDNSCSEKISLLCTYYKNEQCDKVLVIPPSSQFGLIRKKPEILVYFNPNKLDELIKTQEEYLLEASKITKTNGILIYAVQTLTLKESSGVVNDFLSKNKEFELIDEKINFPFTYQTTGMYYAVLKKHEIKVEEVKDD